MILLHKKGIRRLMEDHKDKTRSQIWPGSLKNIKSPNFVPSARWIFTVSHCLCWLMLQWHHSGLCGSCIYCCQNRDVLIKAPARLQLDQQLQLHRLSITRLKMKFTCLLLKKIYVVLTASMHSIQGL